MHTVMKTIRFVSIATASLVIAYPTVRAQKFDEAVVTAECGETALQDVPIAVSDLSMEAVPHTAVINMRGRTTFVSNSGLCPSFAFRNTSNITMRGIGATPFPQVGIVTDSS